MQSNGSFKNTADRLRAARIAAGYRTAKAFAEKHGIPEATYSQHETGTRGLRLGVAKNYCTLLDINVNWLLTGNGATDVDTPPLNLIKEDLSEEQFLTAIKSKHFSNLISNEEQTLVRVGLLAEIIARVTELLIKYNIPLKYDDITKKSIDIYMDILKTSDSPDNYKPLINVVFSTFERHLKDNAIKGTIIKNRT